MIGQGKRTETFGSQHLPCSFQDINSDYGWGDHPINLPVTMFINGYGRTSETWLCRDSLWRSFSAFRFPECPATD